MNGVPGEIKYLLFGTDGWIEEFERDYHSVAHPMTATSLTTSSLHEAQRILRRNIISVIVIQMYGNDENAQAFANRLTPLLVLPGANLEMIIVDRTIDTL